MPQTYDEITQNLAERLCWEVARRDDARIARRLYRKQLVDGVYRLDERAVLDDFFHFLAQLGVLTLLAEIRGAAVQREMLPFVAGGDPRCGRPTGNAPLRPICLALQLKDTVWH
jgi:hypothetical protein